MNYTKVTPEMTIGDLIKCGAYGVFANYIFSDITPDHFYCPLKNYGFQTVGFEEGLARMEELAESDGVRGASYVYEIYPEEERLANYDKARVKMLYFPGPQEEKKPYALIIPGGGFNRQWGFIEGEAIAAHLNRLGYPAFVLYYRVKQEPLMPKPLEDMIRAIAFIEENAEKFKVASGHYMVGGFSAGATITGELGSLNFGWNSPAAKIPAGMAGVIDWKPEVIPKPELLLLGYDCVAMTTIYQMWADAPAGSSMKIGMGPFLRRLGGPDLDYAAVEPFDLMAHIDSTYPKTYITANEDDPTVPVFNSHLIDETLTKLGVEHMTRIGKSGGHSYGLGYGLEVEGWLDECVAFWQKQ